MLKIKGLITDLSKPLVQSFAMKAVMLGFKINQEGLHLEYVKEDQLIGFTPDEVKALNDQAITVEGYVAFLILPVSDYENNVPDFMPNFEGKKWSEWKDSLHEHHEAINNSIIIPLNSFGEEASGQVIADLISNDFLVVDKFTVLNYFPVVEGF